MKKLLSIVLITALSITLLAGCGTKVDAPKESEQEFSEKDIQESTQEKVEYEIPNEFTDGYELAEYEKFNSHADENHLGGTKIYDYIVIKNVESEDDVIYCIGENKDGKEWLILLNGEQFSDISQYSKIIGHSTIIIGEYEGYSDVCNLPVYYATRIFDIDTGETIICLNGILENIENITEEETSQTEKLTPEPTEPTTQKATEPQTEAPTQAPEVKHTEAPTQPPTEKPTEPATELPTEKEEIEILKEYTYSDGFWYTYHFVVVKNISNMSLSVDTNTLAYGEDGSLISVGSGSIDILEPGCTTIYYEAFETTDKIAKYETTSKVERPSYYKYGISNLDYNITDIKNGKIIQVTNNGTEPIEFVEGYLLYLKNGDVVGWNYNYFTDDDFEIKPGETISKQYPIYSEYDSVEFYLTGRN